MKREPTIMWRGTLPCWWCWITDASGAGRWVGLDPTIPRADEARARECARRLVDEVQRMTEVQ